MHEVVVESVVDLVARIEEYREHSVLYRGVGRTTFTLMPSLGRYLAQMEASGLGRADLLRDERGLLDAFKQQSLPYLTIRPSDDWEWLALAQHYRLPTRCLDWSRSPLVALYFALEPAVTYGRRDEDGDVAVYVWIDSEVEVLGASQLAGRSPWDLERTVVFQPPRTHPRISSQSAALSVHPKPWEELDDASVEKLIIPRGARYRFLEFLLHTGVNADTLFPDLEGLSRKLTTRLLELTPWTYEQSAGPGSVGDG
ncbi:MAG: FRG domain-containing protein [Gemmatimonadetes bacterium]|nr:FRG domain-containing protein [Gemmatimonadota bacterium]MBK7835256.1 FRG domain-containing protein [Gemmatimonadota bacterium]MBK9406599.1 FRG domain-containing protein [Gemmatimonadota bacterium]